MLELHTTVNLLESINRFIQSQRLERQNSGASNEQSVVAPRIINQEKGGSIIFVWHDVDKEKPSSFVTHFGIYEAGTQKQLLLYTYEKKVRVVSCSVNQERTLLAFSIIKQKESTDEKNEKKNKEIYQAYLAQLQSVEKIVFSLNMERSTFIKVQFLYPQQQAGQGRDSYMLVFLHKESIGLYRVPMARIGDRGVMMSAQPKTEQIVRKFVWCQWDSQYQRLHYIQNVRLEGREEHISQKLSTFQFYNQAKYENMIEVPINFPFPYIRTADKSHYGDIPLHPGIPELSLNVCVLTQPNGTFCVCYHKHATETKTKLLQNTPVETQNVEYYISMVHHARTLYSCVSNLPTSVVMQKRIVFSWTGSYLAVFLPGHFVHLLNIGPNCEPSHHILCHDFREDAKTSCDDTAVKSSSGKPATEDNKGGCALIPKSLSSPALSPFAFDTSTSDSFHSNAFSLFSEHCYTMKTLLPCQSFIRDAGFVSQNLYDYRNGVLMKLVVNLDSAIDQFRYAYCQTRLSILHYLILHNNDVFTIKKLFDVACEDVTSGEIPNLLMEYLVASTYVEMKKQVDKDILNLLSFTSIQTLRGQFEKSSSGDRLAHISYLSMEVVDFNKKIRKAQKERGTDDFWEMLMHRMKTKRSDNSPKFKQDTVMRVYRLAEMEEVKGKSLWDPMHMKDSFFDGVYTLKLTEMTSSYRKKAVKEDTNPNRMSPSVSSGRKSKLEAVLGTPPVFLRNQIAQESTVFKRRLSVLTEDLLIKHLTKYLPKESHSKAQNVAKAFLFCQAKVSQQLCHLIWSLRGDCMAHNMEDSLLPNLQDEGTDEEYELFQLYERFYVVVQELGYPFPPGFSSFFTALAFKCLDLHLFLQYVDNHVVTLTPDFILQLLEDLSDEDPDVPQVKVQIISRLPKIFADECFERWNHPIVQQRKARAQVANILSSKINHQSASYKPVQVSPERTEFQPLNMLLQHLDHQVANSLSSRPIQYDKALIQDMALYHSKTKIPFTMSSVDF